MELNVKCLINICFCVSLGGGCGPAGIKRAALSLNAAQCHERAPALHNACEGKLQLQLMAFFQRRPNRSSDWSCRRVQFVICDIGVSPDTERRK